MFWIGFACGALGATCVFILVVWWGTTQVRVRDDHLDKFFGKEAK